MLPANSSSIWHSRQSKNQQQTPRPVSEIPSFPCHWDWATHMESLKSSLAQQSLHMWEEVSAVGLLRLPQDFKI